MSLSIFLNFWIFQAFFLNISTMWYAIKFGRNFIYKYVSLYMKSFIDINFTKTQITQHTVTVNIISISGFPGQNGPFSVTTAMT